MTDLPVTLRAAADERRYREAIATGETRPLTALPDLGRWRYWRLIENEYPYTMAFAAHYMLVVKRPVAERPDLNAAERTEFEKILTDYVYPHYDLWFENVPAKRTAPSIYHVHLVRYYGKREDMRL